MNPFLCILSWDQFCPKASCAALHCEPPWLWNLLLQEETLCAQTELSHCSLKTNSCSVPSMGLKIKGDRAWQAAVNLSSSATCTAGTRKLDLLLPKSIFPSKKTLLSLCGGYCSSSFPFSYGSLREQCWEIACAEIFYKEQQCQQSWLLHTIAAKEEKYAFPTPTPTLESCFHRSWSLLESINTGRLLQDQSTCRWIADCGLFQRAPEARCFASSEVWKVHDGRHLQATAFSYRLTQQHGNTRGPQLMRKSSILKNILFSILIPFSLIHRSL